jgi:hypothetical protein
VIAAVEGYFFGSYEEPLQERDNVLEHRCNKCINLTANYVEKVKKNRIRN